MKDIDPSNISMTEAIAMIKLLLDGETQLLFACENILFEDTEEPPIGKVAKARARKKLMAELEIDEFTAKRVMEDAISQRARRHEAYDLIECELSAGVDQETIVKHMMEQLGFSDAYARATMLVVRETKR